MSGINEDFKPSWTVPFGLAVATLALTLAGVACGLRTLHGLAGLSANWSLPPGEAFASKNARLPGARIHPVVEAGALLDSAPLFVPGPWNVAGSLESQYPDVLADSPSVFGEYSPEIQLNAEVLAVSGGELLGVEDSAVQSVRARLDPVQGFPGLGQGSPSAEKVPAADTCHLRFIHLESGRTWERTSPLPAAAEAGGHLWEPLVFFAASGPLGMTATPSTVNTSGLEKLDRELARLVLETALSLSLPAGSYRIVAGP